MDDVKEQVLKFREHCYPILDENEKVVGVLTRNHLLRPRRKRVVLVDNNEASQSVPGRPADFPIYPHSPYLPHRQYRFLPSGRSGGRSAGAGAKAPASLLPHIG